MPKAPVAINLRSGFIYITATFNNTLVSVTDTNGNVVAWGSTGSSGFKGSRKSTPFAATTAIDSVIKKAKTYGLTTAEVFIKGPWPGPRCGFRRFARQWFKNYSNCRRHADASQRLPSQEKETRLNYGSLHSLPR